MKQAGVVYRHRMPDAELSATMLELSGGRLRGTGHRKFRALCAANNVRPTYQQILDVRRAEDPAANAARRERTLRRQIYTVSTAMEVWHFDSAHSPPVSSLGRVRVAALLP